METKNKLRKDLVKAFVMIGDLKIQIAKANDILFEHECKFNKMEEKADIISGKECAHMLGWTSDSIKSEYLRKLGIKFTIDEKGRQQISKQSVIAYLAKKEDQAQ